MTQKDNSSTLIKAIILSILLHIGLVAILLMGDFTSEIKSMKNSSTAKEVTPIEAKIVDNSKLQEAINKIKKQEADVKAAEKKRIDDIEKRADEAKKRRANEEARIKKLEKQRKMKEQEKQRADQAAKEANTKAAKAEEVRKQKELEQKKAEEAAAQARSKKLAAEEAAKKADDLRKKELAERKRKEKVAAEEKAEQERQTVEQEKRLAEQMAAEMATRNKARQQQVMSEIQRFAALITSVIDQNMINDRSTMEGKSCKLLISLASSGFVTQVSKMSGDAVVCEAATRAVYKAGTLPVSKDPEVFKEMRNISVTVVPEF